MEGEARVGFEIDQPVSFVGTWDAADVDLAVDVVEDDLDPARPAAPTSGRRDVDGLAMLERCVDCIPGRRHVSTDYRAVVGSIPSRISASDRSWRPLESKLSAANHASKPARTRGHSPSVMEYHAVSRFRPMIMRCCRKTPSKTNPNRSAARREGALALSHFHSSRRFPSSSNEWRASTKIASVASRVRCSAGDSQMWPISMTPCSGTMLINVAMPRAAPAWRSMIAKARGSLVAACCLSQASKSGREANGPYGR